MRIINDPERFKQDFVEKKKISSKPKENLNLPLDLVKKKTMSAGTANNSLPTKAKKTLVKQLTVNERVTLLQNLNTLKFQNNTKNPNVKLPTIQRASSIKRSTQIHPLPPLRVINREVEEEHKEYVFKYKYLSPKSIFQKYVEKPFLVEGRKCELRYLLLIYIFLKSFIIINMYINAKTTNL